MYASLNLRIASIWASTDATPPAIVRKVRWVAPINFQGRSIGGPGLRPAVARQHRRVDTEVVGISSGCLGAFTEGLEERFGLGTRGNSWIDQPIVGDLARASDCGIDEGADPDGIVSGWAGD